MSENRRANFLTHTVYHHKISYRKQIARSLFTQLFCVIAAELILKVTYWIIFKTWLLNNKCSA